MIKRISACALSLFCVSNVYAISVDTIGLNHPVCTSGSITALVRPTTIACTVNTQANGTLQLSYSSKVYGEIAFDYSKYVHLTLSGELNTKNNSYLMKSIVRLVELSGVSKDGSQRAADSISGYPLTGSKAYVSSSVRLDTGTRENKSLYVVKVYLK